MVLIGGFYDQIAQQTKTGQVLRVQTALGETDIYWLKGYQNVRKSDQNETKEIQKFISGYKPDIVWVGVGAPGQEVRIVEQSEWLARQGVRLAMAVGGTFDFLTGKLKRAPMRWRRWRLEWLYRLLQEPWRWRRQLALFQFWWLVQTR
jgi:N-acetylglucosaminyldiphosphoundecaprenol N-acetyl-beta-D-mannosaminyltransferase